MPAGPRDIYGRRPGEPSGRHARYTGMARYRVAQVREGGRWSEPVSMLVLQVEIHDLVTTNCGGVDSEWVTYWRDATLEDFSAFQINQDTLKDVAKTVRRA